MSAHLDQRVHIAADPDVVWKIGNNFGNSDSRHGPGHTVLASDPDRGSITLAIDTPPDAQGRSWSYRVERIADPATRTVYARRWGHPHFEYAHALWSYQPDGSGGTLLRAVQDFEMTPDSDTDDDEMEAIIGKATAAAMQATKRAAEAGPVPE